MEGMQEIVEEFVIESRESLSEIETDLLTIEADGAHANEELVNKVFRAVHSVKGTAGFIGLQVIGQLAHSIENVLSLVRNKSLVPTPGVIGVLLSSTDKLVQLINDVDHSNEVDVAFFVHKLDKIVAGEIPSDEHPRIASAQGDATHEIAEVEEVEEEIQEEAAPAPSRVASSTDQTFIWMLDRAKIEAEKAAGRTIMEVRVDFMQDAEYYKNPSELVVRLGDTGSILETQFPDSQIPDLTASIPEKLLGCFLVSTVLTADQFNMFWQGPGRTLQVFQETSAQKMMPKVETPKAAPASTPTPVKAVEAPKPVAAPISTPVPVIAEKKPAAPAPKPTPAPEVKPVAKAPETKPAKSASKSDTTGEHGEGEKEETGAKANAPRQQTDSNIRVSVKVLDQLMNLAGELVLSRNQLLQVIDTRDMRALEAAGARIDQVTSDLQETIMQTRMQPIANVFSKFTRIVRDLSASLGKECDLIIEGKEVELDKTIIETIGDPLTHLIRNAVDHGIESVEKRIAKGKKGGGKILLKAYHQDGKVNISISDDGAGIDAVRLRAKAIEKGILTPDKAAAMTDREAINLIFHAGFSMAEQISSVSGRGVGMDVVKTNFEKLGGSIEIDTKVGSGTTFTVHLPLTLAIMPSLIVNGGTDRFAIPQVNISELVRVRAEEHHSMIQRVKNVEVLKLRGIILPLVKLSQVINPVDIMAEPIGDETPHATHIVIVETGHHKYGLVVDSLQDSEEIVVKPLGMHLKNCKCLAGATILGDGQVALILDVAGIAKNQELRSVEEIHEALDGESQNPANDEKMPILLIRNHPNEQFGVMMQIVARIERIRRDQIDTVANQEVLQYRGGTLPLLSLENTISARPRGNADRMYVIVFHANQREIGLIAPEIFDICTISSNVDSLTFQEPGILGSMVINNTTTRLLDPYEIARKSHPEWFVESHKVASVSNGNKPRILFAEDSAFFRKKITQFLDSEGFDVTICEDGEIAWQMLNKSNKPFNLVITDVEMPHMTGLQLCEKIRETPIFANLPVIAVTSLAEEKHVQDGINAGITKYLVKLDRENLIMNINEVLAQSAPTSQRGQPAAAR
jgi:two-component system chemotaxis sensor kinase CheA